MTARISVVAGLAFVALLALIHVVRSDVSLSAQTTSEYAAGPHGWLMVVAFLLSAVGYGALAISVLTRSRRKVTRAGGIVLLLAAAGAVAGGVFVTDPAGTPQDQLSTSGTVHGLGAGLALMLVPVAAVLINLSMARAGTLPGAGRALRWSAALPLVTLILFLVVQAVPMGWRERMLVLAYAVWQIVVADLVRRAPSA